MAGNKNSQSISGKQRFIFLVMIPFLFTLVVIAAGLLIMQKGKGESFANTLVQAGSSVISEGKKLSGAAFSKQTPKPAASSQADATTGQPLATASPQPTDPGKPSNIAGTNTQPAAAGSLNPSPGSHQTDASAEFKQKTDEFAKLYSNMSPSKAAPIIANLSMRDAVYTMLGMNAQQRAVILAKMDPKQAASISKELSKFPPISSGNTTAVQTQLDGLPNSKQSLDEMVKTYSQMPAQSAAILISELMKTNQKEAISIMTNLDSAARAQILSAMSNNKMDPNSIKNAANLTGILSKS